MANGVYIGTDSNSFTNNPVPITGWTTDSYSNSFFADISFSVQGNIHSFVYAVHFGFLQFLDLIMIGLCNWLNFVYFTE